MNNLWILSEERPKPEVICQIVQIFARDYKDNCNIREIRIIPKVINNKFSFEYKVVGITCNIIKEIIICIVSGHSSFVDFLVFYQEEKPHINNTPIYAIEETKTDDSESRNTGVFQRCSKFVYIDYFYPKIKKIMLYNLRVKQKKAPTDTNKFGTKLLITAGVEIKGKTYDNKMLIPFKTVNNLIIEKNSMMRPPSGNIPIILKMLDNKITISGRLIKNDTLSHDPNIGALTIISYCLRKLGWKGRIIVTDHGLKQSHITPNNKFIRISNKLNIELDGLFIPKFSSSNIEYWKYEKSSEKLVSIFLHLIIIEYTRAKIIYENHAGSERGYFITPNGDFITIEKYEDREEYKSGNKSKIIFCQI